ncbi:MAG: DUF992 domain-containing protein [Pseudomonadota bacterium]
MKRLTTIAILASTAALGAAATASEEDGGRIEIGYLECELTRDEGNIILSEQEYACTFDPAESGMPDESYVAEIAKFGLDLSKTESETIAWAVFAPAEKFANGVLAGDYAGVSADAAIGVGAGAKVLVGGLEDSIALQPVSVSTQEGVGVSLAVEDMNLTFVGDKS